MYKGKSYLNIFEGIKDFEQDQEIWRLRDLYEMLEHSDARNSETILTRATRDCRASGLAVEDHFGKEKVSRIGGLFLFLNDDYSKEIVEPGQAYFSRAPKKQLVEQLRKYFRREYADTFKRLSSIASQVGVIDFEQFNAVGIEAMYTDPNAANDKGEYVYDTSKNANYKTGTTILREISGIKKGQLADYMGPDAHVANMMRMKKTERNLWGLKWDASIKEMRLQERIAKAHKLHCSAAREVRDIYESVNATMPERMQWMDKKIGLTKS